MKNYFYDQKLTTEELDLKKVAEKILTFLRKIMHYSWIFVPLTLILIIIDQNNGGIFFKYAGILSFFVFFIINTVAGTFRSFFCNKFRNLISHDEYWKGEGSFANPILIVLYLSFITYFFVDTKKDYIVAALIFAVSFYFIYLVSKFIAKRCQ